MTSILTFASLKTLKKVHSHSVLLSFLFSSHLPYLLLPARFRVNAQHLAQRPHGGPCRLAINFQRQSKVDHTCIAVWLRRLQGTTAANTWMKSTIQFRELLSSLPLWGPFLGPMCCLCAVLSLGTTCTSLIQFAVQRLPMCLSAFWRWFLFCCFFLFWDWDLISQLSICHSCLQFRCPPCVRLESALAVPPNLVRHVSA